MLSGYRHVSLPGQDGCWKDKPRHDSSSHAADALRYLSMAWREVQSEAIAAPTTKEIIQSMIKPRTYNEIWQQYANELRERDDAELPSEFDDFALSNNTNTMEMK
jgi:hypothetical protein